MMKINERLKKVILNVFPDLQLEITPSMSSSDIDDWDSMTHLNLVMQVQEEFNITMEFNDVISIESIGDLMEYLQKKGVLNG